MLLRYVREFLSEEVERVDFTDLMGGGFSTEGFFFNVLVRVGKFSMI